MTFKNLKDLMVKFSDENVCRQYLAQRLWNGKPQCPYCQFTDKIYLIEKGKRYKCKQCQKKFSVTVGTIFENSNIPLSTWFGAIYLITAHKKGISSLQLARDLGVTQKTAWFMLHRIREMIKDKAPEKLKGTVEIDETYVGGKAINIHANKRKKSLQGKNLKPQTLVLGMVERGGKVYAEKLMRASIDQIYPIVNEKIEPNTEVMTDEWSAYQRLDMNFDHLSVNPSLGRYVAGRVHTNTIEGFWSLFKRGVIGIYHYVSFKHLNGYCSEFAFRYNTRKLSESGRFDMAVTQADGRRLKYKDLIFKYRMDG